MWTWYGTCIFLLNKFCLSLSLSHSIPDILLCKSVLLQAVLRGGAAIFVLRIGRQISTHASLCFLRECVIEMRVNGANHRDWISDLAPVPLSIFRSNSKFDENSKDSNVKYTPPITKIFCTRHDSFTVVTCAKYRCDRSGIFKTRAFWIFIEFRIRSKYA